jgi:hypothetical protein
MPYLVKVGYEKHNLNKVTSKGYFIKRIGKQVYTEWGAIDVTGLKRKRFAWHKTTACKYYKFRSEELAYDFKKKKINSLREEGYNQLPSKARIFI